MADEQETIAPGVEAETPIETEVEQTTSPDDPENQDQEGEAVETDEQETDADDELEEFEWNGKSVKGPKGLRESLMMQADYTRKTQEVAATRKELEAREQRLQEQAKASEEDFDLRLQHKIRADRLEQYANIDWRTWWATDPVAAGAAQSERDQLKYELDQIGQKISERASERAGAAQQEFAKRAQETYEFAQKNIKGWTPEIGKKDIAFAMEQGVSQTDLQAALNPTVYLILHLARLGSEVLNRPAAKPQKPAPAPLQTVSAKANPPARKSLSDMNMDEYVAYRNRGKSG